MMFISYQKQGVRTIKRENMEITVEQIIEAVKADPKIIDGLLPEIRESQQLQTLINNKAETIYKSKIDDEVRTMYDREDQEMLDILGERPKLLDNGSKQKTYEKRKELLTELKELRSQKNSFGSDPRVKELEKQISELEKGSGAQIIKDQFDEAKTIWSQKEEEYKAQIESAGKQNVDFIKRTAIQSEMNRLKFNPDVKDSIKNMVIKNVESELMAKTRIGDDNVVIPIGEDGKDVMNPNTYAPKSLTDVISTMEAINDIVLKAPENKGGGAAVNITGSIQTRKVEGKDDQKTLVLAPGSFKSQSEFVNVATKALLDSGVAVTDAQHDKLMIQAYKDNNVANLPE